MPTMYGPLDLVRNELRNPLFQNLGSAPSTPSKGQFYLSTADNTAYYWDGTAWQSMKASGAAVAFGPVVAEQTFGGTPADGVAITAARSDHKHANPLHDATAHAAIPLSALAPPTSNIDMNSKVLLNVAMAGNPNEAANRSYVDSVAQGLDAKQSVFVATTTNIALTGTQTVDGASTTNNQRILVKDQTTPAQNGIYLSNSGGAWTRATDMDDPLEFPGAYVWVEQGTVNADTGWLCTNDSGLTLGTTPITWVQFSGAGQITAGNGLTKSGNTLNAVAGDTTLTVAADSIVVNTAVIATVASLSGYTPTTRTLTAGNGLTGGGDLSANRTFDVGAGTGITVAADTVAVDSTVVALKSDLTAYAPLASPALTGNPTAPTATAGDNDTSIATTAFVQTAMGAIGASGGRATKFAAALTGLTAYATGEVVTHNLNTRDIQVSVVNGSSPYQVVEVDWEATTVNTATIRYNPNLGPGFRAVVVG